MAKSLKEALLEQMAALQERGLAPGELPAEQEDEPSYAQWEVDGDRRATGGERDLDGRRGGPRGQRPRARPPAGRAREQRELREPRGGRERRPGRELREGRESVEGFQAPPVLSPRPPAPMRPPGGPPGPRPPFGPPPPGGPRPAPRADMLRRNAERVQQEQADRGEIRTLLSTYSDSETDDEAVEKFFSQLAMETGALPPLSVVLEALKKAGNANPPDVGNQVRQHYRRARSRPAPLVSPAPTPVAVG